ncbi:uroporphyrinogen-III synthase [Novosphingobium sp. KCTC 2891]|uniref:uroporphyrinogen-III synthase n=1 Tax=Novosphingobium sp. KCTC 2891 TaxID=2989730 RepID=UPI002223DBDF|nr:uroporphyrinogen-III synthase [Novosphingobium sp. KCTC 2891]MCW1382491.1 uroporphyrinogen-III synthase [Novosphingobium sp. KCTC 2891]
MSARPVVVIRPEPGNAATAASARALGLEVIAHPLFDMAPADWAVPLPQGYAGLLAGSANVFRLGGAGIAGLRGLPAHAVGAMTAEAARAAGFTVAETGEGGLQPLVSHLAPGRWLRLAGEKHVPLACPPGVTVDTRVVYAARALPFPADLTAALAQPAVVLLHSGEAAAHFAAECDRLAIPRGGLALACLAPRIGVQAGAGWQAIEIARTHTDDALLALAVQMCQTVCP